MNRAIACGIVILGMSGLTHAQVEPEALVLDKDPALWQKLSTTATVGYDSRYVLYGYTLSPHLYQASVNTYLPLSDRWSSWAGAWYGYQPDGTYQELDLYAGLDAVLCDHLVVGGGYSMFNYLEVPFPADDYAHEFMVHLTASAGPASLRISDQYDSMAEGHLARAVANVKQPLTRHIGVSGTVEYGYAFDYFMEGNAPQYVLIRLGLPATVGETWGLRPFVARSIPLAAIDDYEDDVTYWGLHVDYSF
jgi:hypothetical protein